MATAGVRELKNRLTQYLHRVKQGEEVVVTERGRPIALLQPMRPVEYPGSRETKLARLADRGVLRLPTRPPLRTLRLVKASGPPVSRIIVEERR